MASTFDKVKEIPIQDVIRIFFPSVELKRDGRNLVALCPFHSEKTPSLKINIEKNRWKCYGSASCGGGSAIDLLLKASLAFSPLEAARMIAEKFGIKIEKTKKQAGPKKTTASASSGLTLAKLSEAKKLPMEFLKDLGLHDFRHWGSPAVVIPYFDESGELFAVRYRLSLNGGRRFIWRSGARTCPYGLDHLRTIREKGWVLQVEGESDCWTGRYHGLPVIGIPGKTNWKSEWKRHFKNLQVYLWQEPEAEDLTVKVSNDIPNLLVIPAPDGIKDISEAHIKGMDVVKLIEELKAKAIPGGSLGDSTEDSEVPPELADKIFHPALHIEQTFASVGIVTREGNTHVFSVITSVGGPYPAERIKDSLTTKIIVHPGLSGRWPSLPKAPNLSESVAMYIEKMRELISLDDSRWYSSIAAWTAGTYLFPVFAAYPYLNPTGEKGSGKTKVIDLIEPVAFNALRVIDPTPAVLFRVVHSLRPTLLIDEFERLNTDDGREVRQIINSGYKHGATVPRCEGDNHEIKFFDVYGPKVLAAIRPLGSVTEDRSITVIMSKPDAADRRQNIPVDPSDPIWATIRAGFYRLPFDYREKIFKSKVESIIPEWLRARDRELWLPLIAIASIIDQEAELGLMDDVIGLAHTTTKDRGMSFESDAIVGVLEGMLDGKDGIEIHPVDLVESLQTALNRKQVSPEWIGGRLRGLGFKKADPPRDRRGVIYKITKAKLEDIRCRYTPPETTYIPTYTETYTGASTQQ